MISFRYICISKTITLVLINCKYLILSTNHLRFAFHCIQINIFFIINSKFNLKYTDDVHLRQKRIP